MGCCGSSLSKEEIAELNDSRKYDALLRDTKNEEQRVIKLLLLGTGESGKSTIFKQMQILYEQNGFNEYDIQTFRSVLRRNSVESMQTLVVACQRWGTEFKDSKSERSIQRLMTVDPLSADFWVDDLVAPIKQLWTEEPAIKAAYTNRSRLQLLDSAAYFFDNVERIGAATFRPNYEDILRARLRTSGIVERTFIINDVPFKFVDVGGQRNERRKWIHCFEDVTAVIFVTAISEYDQSLYEDEKVNRLHESVKVFEAIINNKYFNKSTVILFMNKIDLMREKLLNTRINVCFPEYDGNNSFEDCSDYIEKKFLEVSEDKKRMIFPHLTCATDTNNIRHVFDACKVTILNNNLHRLGLA